MKGCIFRESKCAVFVFASLLSRVGVSCKRKGSVSSGGNEVTEAVPLLFK